MADCPGGSYEPRQGTYTAACQTCPAGYFCAAASTQPTQCPIKNYCPAGSTTATLCPAGRYNDDQTHLESSDQCKECTAGFHCSDGEIKGRCDAGRFCDTGATSATDTNKPCPAGFYCPAYDSAECSALNHAACTACSDDACKQQNCCLWPIRCEENHIRLTTGATQKSECSVCPDGYYCLAGANTQKICPRGFYCEPGATEKVTPCPEGKANNIEGKHLSTSCLDCGVGYLCNKKGISDKNNFKCPLGYYCASTTTDDSTINPCPAGTYRDTVGAESLAQCHDCPAGYYCPVNTINPIPCRGGWYCPINSTLETVCTPGTYCHEKSATETQCPRAFYCPNNTDIYTKCREHYYCPAGAQNETLCPAGMIGWGNPDNYDIPSGCQDCDPGTYSELTDIGSCPTCPAGYVCLGGTLKANPTDEGTDKGYECQAGYYCPSGSSAMTACPIGTFINTTLKSALTDCEQCPVNTFSSEIGSTTCQDCGSSSRANQGASQCSCQGNNRKFTSTNKWCICIDRFESATASQSQVDSSEDCSSRLIATCPDTQDTEGNCVSTTDSCNATCGTNGGTRVLGMCDCNAKTLTNAVCPESCRSSRNRMFLSATGDILVSSSDGSTNTTQSMSGLSNVQGTVRYSTTADNRFVSVGVSGSTFTSNYEASSQLQGECSTCNAARRRLSDGKERRNLASTGTINNPVVCISEGDILMFDVDSTTKSYPEYVSNSLLNTNTAFDYGDFLDLKTKIEAGTTVTYFMFQFTTSGIYVFMNSLDNTQQMMVAVVGSSQKCPDSSEYISPISMKSMLLVGAAESDVVYEPDWVFIICLMIGIMILIGFMIGVYYYLRRRWGTKMRRIVKYRKLNLKGDALPSIRADNRCFEYMMKNKDLRITKRLRQTQDEEITYSKIKEIRIQLQNSLGRTKGEIFDDGPDGEYTKLINEKDNIMMQLDKLKGLILDHKDNINGTLNVDDNSDDDSGEHLMKNGKMNFKTLHDNLLVSNKMDHDLIGEGNKLDDDELNKMMLIIQKKRDSIDKNMDDEYKAEADDIQRKLANLDPDGDDDMRKKLMDELNAKLDRIDNSLKSEEDAQMAALQGKLAQRKKRRGMIVDDYVKLQQEKEELNDNSYVRKQIDKEIEKKYDEMEDGIEKEREEGLKIIKENNDRMGDFEDKLRKNAGDKKNFDKHLEEYNNNRNKMQDSMRKEMLDQEKQLEDELRRRRDARAAKIEVEKGDLISKAKEGVQDKLRDIEEKERAFEGLKANELDPFLKDIVKKSEQKVGNRRELDMIRAEADKALAKYRDAEDEEREKIRQELLDKYRDQDGEEDEEIMTLRQQLLKEILDKEEEKESQLAKFKREVEETPSAEDKQKIISDHNDYKQDVEEELKKMAEDGANRLEQRIRDRRARRKKEEDDLLKERMKEVDENKQNDEDSKHRQVEDVRDDLEERTIEEIVRGLQAAIPKEEVPSALEKIMDDRQMKELMELLVKQYEEKAQAMKDAVMKIMKEKSDEIEALNKEVAESKSFVREAYEKGGITEETMNEELQKIKKRYDERLSDINSKYGNKELEAEQKIVRDFAEKHTNEQIALEEKHMRERERFFSKLLPESAMKRILHGMIAVEDEKLNDFIQDKYEERDARLRELEEKMAQFRLEMADTQKELDDLDEYQRKLREKELLAQRNFDRQQQKLLEQKRREQEAELTKVSSQEQREEMVKKHLEELNDLNRILGVERKRQIDIHRKMFEDKRAAIEKRRQELIEKRAEQERLRKEKEEEEEKNKKEMTELEKKRQERYLKLINENNRNMKLIDEYAYSTPIDWADRRKVKRDGKTPMSDAMNLGKGTKMTKEERLMKKIERIHNASKGPLTLELLARIMRLEEQATEMQDF